MFSRYKEATLFVNGVHIKYRIGGQGPALLLLHGHPQTHFIWHKVADQLAEHFTVIAADLRGYGDSDKPESDPDHFTYSKRMMALDMVELMGQLGFSKFSIIAHDRGARAAHRLALDHPQRVERMMLLDIAPTLSMYQQTNQQFARAYWHWFFLIRPAPLPESLIESDPDLYLKSVIGARSSGMGPFTDEAVAEYERCLKLKGSARGICEDYRAAATIDLEHDQQDIDARNKITCPLRVYWGETGTVGKVFDVIEEWKQVATNVGGNALPSGHYIPEDVPERLLAEIELFFMEEYA
ncbi:alpha/beta fold hydrolase [Vibrio hangzhouensis]|uniref:Haloacetate dehalogenase n=1 Tax=Vibrio hangzhouensis TaxID=462991 RepID=A0A1H5V356_9VIBR|nr:alpha/beta hydrolase [Vibrio hangzhouensis]SEF81168.1 haloacetate dehalogenase [Vibrio hangzhouensis]